MIYVILDTGYESDGYSDSKNIIIYITTDKESCEKFWEKYCATTKIDDDAKWTISYEMYEYPENYNYFDYHDSEFYNDRTLLKKISNRSWDMENNKEEE